MSELADRVVHATHEEAVLLEPLMDWLRASQRLRDGGGAFQEVPWCGRRIDLVTCGKRLRTSAFELKLGSPSRVIEQAIYNRSAFDRSYIVVPAVPREPHLELARACGVGVIVVEAARARLIVESPVMRPGAAVRRRLLQCLRRQRPPAGWAAA